jgi:hypothetical protein
MEVTSRVARSGFDAGSAQAGRVSGVEMSAWALWNVAALRSGDGPAELKLKSPLIHMMTAGV